MDTVREMQVTKKSEDCIKSIEELRLYEVENKRDMLKSEIQAQDHELKKVEKELQDIENAIYEDKIPNVVNKYLEPVDEDKDFRDMQSDELLLGKDIKVKM